jgi:hypothetical protein
MSTSKVVGNTIKIELTSLYYEESNPFCPTVQLPFLQPVQVGVLPKGRYKVEVNGGTMVAQNSSISISDPTTTATDEHVYAEVYFVETLPGKDYVNIKGYNPSDCFSFDHMEWFSNGNDVYSILPIMKLLRNDCPMKMVPFEYKFKVPKQLSAKEVLLHVRGMRGNSVNALYQTEQPL